RSSPTRSASGGTAASSRRGWRSAQSDSAVTRRTSQVARRAEIEGIAEAMTRVLSGAVLIALAVGVVWYAPPLIFLAVAFLIAVLAVNELVSLARASGLGVSRTSAGFATAIVVGSSGIAGALETCLITALVAVASASLGAWRGGPAALATVSASL